MAKKNNYIKELSAIIKIYLKNDEERLSIKAEDLIIKLSDLVKRKKEIEDISYNYEEIESEEEKNKYTEEIKSLKEKINIITKTNEEINIENKKLKDIHERLYMQNVGLENDLTAITKRNEMLIDKINSQEKEEKGEEKEELKDEVKCLSYLNKIIKEFRHTLKMPGSIMILLFDLVSMKEFIEVCEVFKIVSICQKHFKEDKLYFTYSQLIYYMTNKKKPSQKMKDNCLEALKWLENMDEGKIVKQNIIIKFYWK